MPPSCTTLGVSSTKSLQFACIYRQVGDQVCVNRLPNLSLLRIQNRRLAGHCHLGRSRPNCQVPHPPSASGQPSAPGSCGPPCRTRPSPNSTSIVTGLHERRHSRTPAPSVAVVWVTFVPVSRNQHRGIGDNRSRCIGHGSLFWCRSRLDWALDGMAAPNSNSAADARAKSRFTDKVRLIEI